MVNLGVREADLSRLIVELKRAKRFSRKSSKPPLLKARRLIDDQTGLPTLDQKRAHPLTGKPSARFRS